MDFFVAGRWRNRAAITPVLEVLDRAGFSSYCFIRNNCAEVLSEFGDGGDHPDELAAAVEGTDLVDPRIAQIFESDMAAQRTAKRFLIVMPAGLAAHLEAGVSYGLGKPCYSVGPVLKTETLYRIFERMFTDVDHLAEWLLEASKAR